MVEDGGHMRACLARDSLTFSLFCLSGPDHHLRPFRRLGTSPIGGSISGKHSPRSAIQKHMVAAPTNMYCIFCDLRYLRSIILHRNRGVTNGYCGRFDRQDLDRGGPFPRRTYPHSLGSSRADEMVNMLSSLTLRKVLNWGVFCTAPGRQP